MGRTDTSERCRREILYRAAYYTGWSVLISPMKRDKVAVLLFTDGKALVKIRSCLPAKALHLQKCYPILVQNTTKAK